VAAGTLSSVTEREGQGRSRDGSQAGGAGHGVVVILRVYPSWITPGTRSITVGRIRTRSRSCAIAAGRLGGGDGRTASLCSSCTTRWRPVFDHDDGGGPGTVRGRRGSGSENDTKPRMPASPGPARTRVPGTTTPVGVRRFVGAEFVLSRVSRPTAATPAVPLDWVVGIVLPAQGRRRPPVVSMRNLTARLSFDDGARVSPCDVSAGPEDRLL
jgi:hypothetical protein